MKKYNSKISYWLFIPVILLFLYAQIAVIIYKDWFPAIIILGINILIISIFSRTYYQIEGSSLKVVSGFLINKKIAIKNIRKIAKTNSPLSSPALSLTDRIEVFYSKYDSVIISPENQKEFVNALKSINYDIEIAL